MRHGFSQLTEERAKLPASNNDEGKCQLLQVKDRGFREIPDISLLGREKMPDSTA
jgi:hypothetical protein